MTYKIINTGSDGNCTIIDETIMIDCGVSYKRLAPYINKVQLIMLTHIHCDHFNKITIKKIAQERPTLRFGCCEWLLQDLLRCGVDIGNIDLYTIGKKYDYGEFQIVPIKLYHDVKQCGYRLFKGGEKLIYATDTYTLEGIKAIGYDYYLIEGNYQDLNELSSRSINKIYENRVRKTHLSKEYATGWLLENMGLNSVYEWMHEHKER